MKICIPSYNRLSGVQEKTIKLLNKYDVANINIFVSTEKDYEEYKKEEMGNIVLVPNDYSGIGAVRSYIVNEWSTDKDNIVLIDDDIEMVKDLNSEEVNVKEFFESFFKKLEEEKLYFGGLPLCANPFFLKNNWSTTLKYISGAIQFVIIDKSRDKIECFRRMYEDFCYDIMYFKRDGGILRYNGCSPITKNYNEIGGIASEMNGMDKRLDCEHIADEIITKFGDKCVKKYFKKKSARGPACWNLRLNWRIKPEDII
jgi:hypothetical protein